MPEISTRGRVHSLGFLLNPVGVSASSNAKEPSSEGSFVFAYTVYNRGGDTKKGPPALTLFVDLLLNLHPASARGALFDTLPICNIG